MSDRAGHAAAEAANQQAVSIDDGRPGNGYGRNNNHNDNNHNSSRNNSSFRQIHEELLRLENLKDLLFDLFHSREFYAWMSETVRTGRLNTNNLLDFDDKCFMMLFSGYVHALRLIEIRSNKRRNDLIMNEDQSGNVSVVALNVANEQKHDKRVANKRRLSLSSGFVGGSAARLADANTATAAAASAAHAVHNAAALGAARAPDAAQAVVRATDATPPSLTIATNFTARKSPANTTTDANPTNTGPPTRMPVKRKNPTLGRAGADAFTVDAADAVSAAQASASTVPDEPTDDAPRRPRHPVRPVGTVSEFFWRYGRRELATLRQIFPSRQVSSPNILNAANGLKQFIRAKFHDWHHLPILRGELDEATRRDICYFLLNLYTFCDCNMTYMLYMIRVIISIGFPGPWSKTVHILEGSSNGGKSDFVEALRSFYNSMNGVLEARLWKTPSSDIGTPWFPLMENLICQSDEVDMVYNQILKSIISKTSKQCRSFSNQESQQLFTLAKVFMTVNRQPQVDQSDDGVLTRTQIVLPIFHSYEPLTLRENNSAKIQKTAAYNFGYQLSKRRYPQGAHSGSFARGMFFCTKHFGAHIINRDESVFLAADMLHTSHVVRLVRNEPLQKLTAANVDNALDDTALTCEMIFHASTTDLDELSAEQVARCFDRHTHSDYFLHNTFAKTQDSFSNSVYVNLTSQPLILSLSKFDFHSSIDAMVRFDAIYKVTPSLQTVHWSLIERLLRNHLHEFYLNEESGSSAIFDSAVTQPRDGSVAAEADLFERTGAAAKRGNKRTGRRADAMADESSVGVLTSNSKLNKKIDYLGFYARFKIRYATLQHKDPQTRQRSPDLWCLSITRRNGAND